MIRKVENKRAKSGIHGGNKMSQTFKRCEECKTEFGPLKRLNVKFCSHKCGYENIKKRIKKPKMKLSKKVRSCQRRTRYLIEIGKIKRNESCEHCGKIKYLETAHINYEDPYNIKWLCRSCHRKWDWGTPKQGENYSGKKAKKEK